MTHNSDINTLAQWLSGRFENRAQALDQPAWFVSLCLWHQPLPQRIQGCLAIFAEQANILSLANPYRQRILLLHPMVELGQIQVQYLAFKEPGKFRGAGANPQLLENLQESDWESLPGCQLSVTFQASKFAAQPVPGSVCCFQYDGQTRQVVLGFEVSETQFWSYDRGVDTETGQSLWGAIMGPYEFERVESFAAALPL